MNQLVLTARIAESHPLRFTPSGTPAVNLTLSHESQAQEAQAWRQVELEVSSVALGQLANTLAQQPVGRSGVFSGFIAKRGKSKGIVFHIQQFISD